MSGMRELRVDLRAEMATALFDNEVLGARDIIDELAVCSATIARTYSSLQSTVLQATVLSHQYFIHVNERSRASNAPLYSSSALKRFSLVQLILLCILCNSYLSRKGTNTVYSVICEWL